MDEYFGKYLDERRRADEAEKTLKAWIILGFILFFLLVGQSIRYSLLSQEYNELKTEYENYQSEFVAIYGTE